MQYIIKRRYFLCLAIISFFATYLPGVVFAEQSASVKIQPGIIEEKADPGKDYALVFRATNTGVVEQTYSVIVRDIESIDEAGRPIFAGQTESTGFEMSSWVNISKTQITVPSKEMVEVPFTVSVPKDATPGGHFGAIFVTVAGEKPQTIGAAVGYQVGALLSFQVSGDVVEQAEIREFTTDKNFYGNSKVTFSVKVKNLGNSLARPHGAIEIIDMFGKKTTSIPINDTAAAVFPRSERTYISLWDDNKLHLGKYTAIVSMNYGSDVQHTIYSETEFWIIPSSVVTPVLGFLFFVALILYLSVKLYIRKKMREYGINTKSQKEAHNVEFSSRATVMFIVFFAFTAMFLLVLFALLA